MRSIALVVAAVAAASCAPDKTVVDFTVPTGDPTAKFLDMPWPSDVMRVDGGLDLNEVPNPFSSSSLEDVIRLFATNTAYPATGTLYFRVAGGVDEGSLPPDAAASLTDGSSMFLVETDTLRRVPLVWKQFAKGTSFLPPGTVAAQPLLGAVPHGRFALVVTSNARAKDGSALGASPDLRALLTCQPLPKDARAVDCAPYQKLAADLGLPAESIALVQMITPEDSSSGLVDAADVVRELGPPAATGLSRRSSSPSSSYVIYDGVAGIAQLQAGVPPYDTLDPNYVSGGFVLGDDGRPVVQRIEEVPFLVTVPTQPPPPGGYCVVINGHGTGGDLESGLGSGPSAEAFQIAQAGCAMFAMSEPLHRTRAGYREGQEEVLTFNFFNPVAGRDNWRQSAIEKVQLVSLAQALTIPPSVTGGAAVRFDADHIAYFGHSQGGITGALFVAVEHRIAGAFLSGAGAGFQASLVEKVDPTSIADILKVVLDFPSDSDEDIDLFHPVITLLQSWVDPADPINYGDLWSRRQGRVPHLVMTSGLLDTFTPPRCHGALAAAFHLPLVEPVSEDIDVLDVLGIEPAQPPIEGNFETVDGGQVTAGVLQYPNDGHFAVFDNPDAQSAMRTFFTTLQQGAPIVRVNQE